MAWPGEGRAGKIMLLHEKLAMLCEKQCAELLATQRQQLAFRAESSAPRRRDVAVAAPRWRHRHQFLTLMLVRPAKMVCAPAHRHCVDVELQPIDRRCARHRSLSTARTSDEPTPRREARRIPAASRSPQASGCWLEVSFHLSASKRACRPILPVDSVWRNGISTPASVCE